MRISADNRKNLIEFSYGILNIAAIIIFFYAAYALAKASFPALLNGKDNLRGLLLWFIRAHKVKGDLGEIFPIIASVVAVLFLALIASTTAWLLVVRNLAPREELKGYIADKRKYLTGLSSYFFILETELFFFYAANALVKAYFPALLNGKAGVGGLLLMIASAVAVLFLAFIAGATVWLLIVRNFVPKEELREYFKTKDTGENYRELLAESGVEGEGLERRVQEYVKKQPERRIPVLSWIQRMLLK